MPRAIQIGFVTVPSLIAFFVGIFGGEWSKMFWPAWVFGAIAVAILILSMIWNIVSRAYFLEKRLEPKISISDPIEDHIPWDRPKQSKSRRFFSVRITNVSQSDISRCSVKELSFTNTRGRTAPESGRFFCKISERLADPKTHSYDNNFNLRGENDHEDISICWLDETNLNNDVHMTYAANASAGLKSAINRRRFPHWLTIRVTADNLGKTIDKTFKIDVSDKGYLEMETVHQ